MGGLHYVCTYPFHVKGTFKCKTGTKNKTKLHK